jgi:hypothetical protein
MPCPPPASRAGPAHLAGIAGLLLVAACSQPEQGATDRAPEDPLVAEALADPILTDPDLTAQNQVNAALAVAGPVNAALPPIDRGEEAIAAATEAAQRLVGSGIPPLPEPAKADLRALREAVTAVQMAAAAGALPAGCAAKVEYTARWAALLPAPLQVYPRGAVEEAAGSDAPGCRLRVVHFKVPVAAADVAAFHHARLRGGGLPVRYAAEGEEHVLRGRRDASSYLIYVREAADGLTAADIVVAG